MPPKPHQIDAADEFVQLVSAHQGQLYGHVYALVQNAADAEDVVQKTVLTLWRRFDDFERGTDFAAWAWQTARYETLNFLKTRRRSRLVFSDELVTALADRAAVRNSDCTDDCREALETCLGERTDEDRQLLDERYHNNRQVKEIAQRCGRSPQSITNSLRRIRLAIYRCVQQRLARQGQSL